MRVLTPIAVLVATAALTASASPAQAGQWTAGTPDHVVGFTPPIGSEHGSVLARPLIMNRAGSGPMTYEMDIIW